MMEWTSIIVALITVIIPSSITLITSNKTKRNAKLDNIRTNIIVLITQDHLNVMEGYEPINFPLVHEIYDVYVAMGGNSYIHEVIDDYDEWINKRRKNEKRKS